ncbi:Nucleoporin nup84 [Coemansia sp. RSA 2131]|nr:Nucleoporin nup84 [Coemansia sp. RSA 2131]
MAELVAEFASVVEGRDVGGDGSSGASAARVYKQLAKQRSDNATAGALFGAEGAQQRVEGKWWQSESDTWDLLARLYEQRQQRRDSTMDESMDANVDDDATLTDFVRAQELLERDGQLAEYVEVRRWLEDTAREFQPVETRKGYLFYTRRSIRNQDTADSNAMSDTNTQLVTDIDPDASSRQRRDIALEDHEYSTSLLRTLFEYVRRGRVSDAMSLCVESDEPWRAASIKGGLFWRDPRLEDEQSTESVGGNINRNLWKHACAALAHDTGNDSYERALYAALSGRVDEVLAVCVTWDDFVWAHVNAVIEMRMDQGLRGACVYEQAPATSFAHVQSRRTCAADMTQVFDIVESLDARVQSEARDPLRRLQRALATDTFAEYVAQFAQALSPETDIRMVRVVAHASLCVRQSGAVLPEADVSAVLEAYVDRLALDHDELVAAYVAQMPKERQTPVYAQFVQMLDVSRDHRMRLLQRAERHGLDSHAVCRAATSAGVQTGEPSDEQLGRFELAEPSEPITDVEQRQVRALEWTTSSPHLYPHALAQVCTLSRQFLLNGRTNAATVLLNSLPADFVQPEWIAEGAPLFQEYMHVLSLCDALAYYATWAETVCRQPTSTLQSFEHKQRVIDASVHVEQLLRRVLDVDWLGAHVQDGSARTSELQKLRMLYVPEIVFRLHGVLYETRHAVPQNLARSLDLAQMVASDGLGIYRELARPSPVHPNGRLIAFMALMRKSAFELLRVQESTDSRVALV